MDGSLGGDSVRLVWSKIVSKMRIRHNHISDTEYSPREIARPCPNCGVIHWNSELNHSSSIKTHYGGSTLYGVCKICADRHDKDDIGDLELDSGMPKARTLMVKIPKK